MPRVISSAQTFIIKFIIPTAAVAFLIFVARLGGRGSWPFLSIFGVLIAWSLYWYYARLKKVTIEQDGLIISDYLREVRVPWRSVTQVSGSRWINTRQVKITFDPNIGLGTPIIFMPKHRFLWPGQEHPIAQELRELAKLPEGARS